MKRTDITPILIVSFRRLLFFWVQHEIAQMVQRRQTCLVERWREENGLDGTWEDYPSSQLEIARLLNNDDVFEVGTRFLSECQRIQARRGYDDMTKPLFSEELRSFMRDIVVDWSTEAETQGYICIDPIIKAFWTTVKAYNDELTEILNTGLYDIGGRLG